MSNSSQQDRKNNSISGKKNANPAPDGLMDNSSNDIIIINTDDKISPQPGGDLFISRKNRIVSTLGSRADLVSVVVLAYNRLEKTRICVECIQKYTTDIDYELILFDNGSSDGTLEFFKSVDHPRKKIVRVTKNIGSLIPGFMNIWTRRYLAFITNDTYVTRNWLKNLLTCLKSCDEIGMVVPASSNTSNLQDPSISFNSLDEMQEKAAKFNKSDPKLWQERLRLLPICGIYKKEALDIAGWIDYGFFHDFADDDITFRIRRAGYKTMFCKDTFVHHDHVYSSPGAKNPEEFARSLDAGKKDFQSKYYGIDAWEDVNNYEITMMSLVNSQEIKPSRKIEILGIDVLCGTPILELKNLLNENVVNEIKLSAFTTDPKYWLDLKTICSGNVVVGQVDQINANFEGEFFDYVLLGRPINTFPDAIGLLKNLHKVLKKDGILLLKIQNTFDIISVLRTLGATVQINSDPTTSNSPTKNVYGIRIDEFVNQMLSIGYIPQKIVPENWTLNENFQNVLRNTIAATGLGNNPDEIYARAFVRYYVLELSKK